MNARLLTLGELRLVVDHAEPLSGRRKELVVLAFLARRAPLAVDREELAALIWGERDEERARHSLRQAILRLKKTLGDALEVTPDRVRLSNGSPELDVREFENDVAADRLSDAVARWHGDFLAGTEDAGGESFRAWLEQERVGLRRQFAFVLGRLMAAARAAHNYEEEIRVGRVWVQHLPHDEDGHEHLLDALLRADRLPEAAAHSASVHAALRREGDKPSVRLRRFADEIVRRGQRANERPVPSAAVLAPDLVGREAELEAIQAALTAARRGTGGAILVEGAEGIGRTRLCRELVRYVGQGAEPPLILQVRAADTDAGDSWSGLKRLLSPLASAPALAGADPDVLAALSDVLPAVRTRFPRLPTDSSRDLASALVAAMEAVAEETPVLVVIDDIHLLDIASRDLALALVRRPPRWTSIVITAPSGELPDRMLASDLDGFTGAGRIKLQPLPVAAVDSVIDSMIALPPADRARLAERAHVETGGVPLLVVELVTALADTGALQLDRTGLWHLSPDFAHESLPLAVDARQRIAERFAELPDESRQVLHAAAIIGTKVDARLLEAISGLEPARLDRAIDDLIRRRLFRPSPVGQPGYEFPNEIVRRVAYERIPRGERRTLHLGAASAFAGLEGDDSTAARAYHRDAARSLRPLSIRRWHVRRLVAGVIGLMVVGALVTVTLSDAPAASRFDDPRLIVATFENQTGDSRLDVLGRIAADWISQGAARTALVRVTPPILERPDSAAGSPRDRLERIRQRAGAAKADIAIYGTYYLLGDSLRFESHVMNVQTGEQLAVAEPVVAGRAQPLDAIESIRQSVLGALAPWVDPRMVDAAAVQSPPPNFEAYKAFAEGLSLYYGRRGDSAITYFMQAYAIDTTFTIPLLYAVTTLMGTGGYGRADSLLEVVRPRRSDLAPYDRLLFDIHSASLRGDKPGVYTAARDAEALAPGTFAAAMLPAAAIAINRPKEALSYLLPIDTAAGEGSRYPGYWTLVSTAAHMAEDFPLQYQVGQVVRRKFSYDPRYLHYEARALAAMGSVAQLDTLLLESLSWPSIPRWGPPGIRVHIVAFDELLAHGHAREARSVLERALTYYSGAHESVKRLPKHRHDVARVLYRLGRLDEARRTLEELDAESDRWPVTEPEIRILAGFIAARQGDTATVVLTDQWLRDHPTPYLTGNTTLFRSWLAASLGRREEAVRLMRRAISEGATFSDELHALYELSLIRDYPPLRQFLKPAG